MVSTITSALSVWKSHVQSAPDRMRKAWRPGAAGGSGTAGSEVTWQTVRASGPVRTSMSGWR